MNEQLKQLSEIRTLMERSSRFISLSGLSGVAAGTVALLGAGVAYWYIYQFMPTITETASGFVLIENPVAFLLSLAFVVLLLAIGSGIYFTVRNSRKKNLAVWDRTTQRLIINLLIPLIAGGLFALVLISRGQFLYISGLTLLFYGLALINASNYTFSEIRYLGLLELLTGMLAVWFVGYGLLFWAIGFGVLHIVYGILMYSKYDKKMQ